MSPCTNGSSRRAFLAAVASSPLAFSVLARAAETNAEKTVAEATPADLRELLQRIQREHKLPALAAGAMKNGAVVGSGAVGVRKLGEAAPVTLADKFHIGSCTKAMTATLAAMLVEEGKLRWDQTLGETFPERAEQMQAAYRKVTLELLLTHRSGAPANSSDYGKPKEPVTAQRLAYLDSVTTRAPATEPGQNYAYSNAGYIITGAMLERVTGQAWEELIQARLFRPLGMTSAGFGPPSRPGQADHPWGHVYRNGKFEPRYGDNPPALGPAGTVHCALLDYLKFAQLHTGNGANPPGLLRPATCSKLHEPPAKSDYACGWMVVKRDWARGEALTHAGSNTMNYFVVWLAPKIDLCLAVASNAAGDKVPAALDAVAGELVGKFAG